HLREFRVVHDIPDLLPDARAARLARTQNAIALLEQVRLQQGDLCGFPAAVRPFKRDKHSASGATRGTPARDGEAPCRNWTNRGSPAGSSRAGGGGFPPSAVTG